MILIIGTYNSSIFVLQEVAHVREGRPLRDPQLVILHHNHPFVPVDHAVQIVMKNFQI